MIIHKIQSTTATWAAECIVSFNFLLSIFTRVFISSICYFWIQFTFAFVHFTLNFYRTQCVLCTLQNGSHGSRIETVYYLVVIRARLLFKLKFQNWFALCFHFFRCFSMSKRRDGKISKTIFWMRQKLITDRYTYILVAQYLQWSQLGSNTRMIYF